MSGGSCDYKYSDLNDLAEIINDYVNKDFKDCYNDGYSYDRLEEFNKDQRLRVLNESMSLVRELKVLSCRAKALEWLLSSDYGAESYLKELDRIEKEEPKPF